MTDGVSFDFSEILQSVAHFEAHAKNAGENLVKAIKVTSGNVKKDWRAPLEGSKTLPRGPYSISYDIESDGKTLVSEIGPTLKAQGALIGMLEYGTPSTGPTGYGAEALRKNQGDFEKGILIALGDL